MAADAFELGEHPGDEASNPVRVGSVACERVQLDIIGEVVGMMSVGAEVLCRIAGRLAEEYDVGRRSDVAVFSRGFSHLTLSFVARGIRTAEAGAKRAAR
jgi:hypothetical protein